jgi:Helix-turn-helix domain
MNFSTNAVQRRSGSVQKPLPTAATALGDADSHFDFAAGLDNLRQRLERMETVLERMETVLTLLVEQRTAKEWYTTAEVAKLIRKSDYTVREYCRKGQVEAEKAANDRGWLISHAALTHLRNFGPVPEHEVQRGLDR